MKINNNNSIKFKEDAFNIYVKPIMEILGNYTFDISDYGKDNEGTFWFLVDLIEGDPIKCISCLHLQFGAEPLVLTYGSIDNISLDVDLDKLYTEIVSKMKRYHIIKKSSYHDITLEIEDDGYLTYSLQIESLRDRKLPTLADIDELMTFIQQTILSHNNEKNSR